MKQGTKMKVTRFVVFSIAVLAAELLIQYLTTLLPYQQPGSNPYLSTLLRMGLILAIFYPGYLVLEDLMEKVARKYVKKGKEVTNDWWKGTLLSFGVAVVVLLWGFASVWYNRNLVMDVFSWLKNLF